MRKQNVLKKVSLFLALALCIGFAGGALLTKKPVAVAETADATVGYEAVYSSDNPVPEIAANVRPSVVQVITSAATWDQRTREVSTEEIGYGSGTYFRALDEGEGGYILTNNHVVDEGETYEIQWLDGTIMDATLVGAAIIGAVGAGLFADVREGAREMVHISHTVPPIPENAETYRRLHRVYREVYASLRGGAFRQLSSL